MEKYLWKFYWDCDRSGKVEGLFVATEEEVANVIGKYAYFGEILGKHSEVCGTIDEGEITKLNVSSSAVLEVSKHLGETWGGYNPLHYIKYACVECEDSYHEYEMHTVDYKEGKGICDYCIPEDEE